MVKDNASLSPEKQLLKLIEEPGGPGRPKDARRGRGISLISPGAWQGRWAFAGERLKAFLRSWTGPLDIKKINGLLSLATALAGVYFIASSVILATKFSVLPSFSFKTEGAAKAEALTQASQVKAAAFYLEKIHSRDIFKIGRRASQEVAPPPDAASKAEEENILSRYKLVGISWSNNPDAMIEDTQAQRTYFLKRGQAIDSVKIQAILKDKVVLNYRGTEVELR